MKLRITVHGTAYEVEVEVLDAGDGFPTSPLPKIAPVQTSPAGAPAAAPVKPAARPAHPQPSSGDAGSVTSPIAGTVLEIKCRPGDQISQNQELLVIEAMKMETSIAAPAAGKIRSVDVAVGDAVREGQVLVQFE
ncbi:MAG TPA: biotin/lipoyl-binding protein [bacterium]|nr:biotin/lipoyl-binding protein [bacterium]